MKPTEDHAPKETERARERIAEDDQYVPVILKRTDEARRHPDDVLELAIFEGAEQLERRFLSLLLSAIAAGLILGFSVLAVGVMKSEVAGTPLEQFDRLLVALVYPLGFIVCIMSGTQLFTEHTATAVYPILDGRVKAPKMFRLWGVVLLGNLIGAFISACLLTWNDGVIQARHGYLEIGQHLVEFSSLSLLGSAVIAGWIMAQGAWLIMATPPALSQIVCIFVVTFIIGLGELHHSIAGSVEVFTALLMGAEFGVGDAARFLLLAVLGNLIGGSGFVALLNYSHVRKTQADENKATT